MEEAQLRAMAIDFAIRAKPEVADLIPTAQLILAFIKGEIQ